MAFKSRNEINIGNLNPEYITVSIRSGQETLFETDADLKRLADEGRISLDGSQLTYDSYDLTACEALKEKNIL